MPPTARLVALGAISMACSISHLDPPLDSGADSGSDAGPRQVPGRRIPWSDLSIRFLGLTDLVEPNGDDVELRWELTHAPLEADDRVDAVAISPRGWLPPIVETEVLREPTRTFVRVRIAIDGAYPPGAEIGEHVGLALELRRDGSAASWEVAPRYVHLRVRDPFLPGPPIPLPPRGVSTDGRLEIELLVAPDVATRDGAWVMELETEYELAYRVHNRTEESLSVHLFAISPNAPGVDAVMTIAAESFVDLPLPTMLLDPEECSGDRSCHDVSVDVPGEESWAVDLVHRTIVVP